MIKQITDKDELQSMMKNSTYKNQDNVHWVTLYLTSEQIEQWKHEGYFRHIRNQIQNIDGIKFSCLQNINGMCEYHFICPSQQLKNRIVHMLKELYHSSTKKSLMNCSNLYDDQGFGSLSIKGEIKACSLF